MDTRSQHLILDAITEREFTKEDLDHIKSVIERDLTVVDRIEYKFTPQGETVIFILSESHFAIHTYPEYNYFSMDIYVCNMTTDLQKIVDDIKDVLPLKKINQKILHRGKLVTSENAKNLRFIYAITIMVAFCSIVYEFLLAQSLSTTMGNTALRYNLTIGIYIASMGFGALLYKKIVKSDLFKGFVATELILSTLGAVAPILVLVADYVFNLISKSSGVSFFSNMIQIPIFIFNHLLIVAVGFLSGLELPLLMDMAKEFKEAKGYRVLAFDYLGTLLGAILFPIVILPELNIFTIGYALSFLNILVGLFVLKRMKITSALLNNFTYAMLALWFFLIVFSAKINQLIIKLFYFGGNI